MVKNKIYSKKQRSCKASSKSPSGDLGVERAGRPIMQHDVTRLKPCGMSKKESELESKKVS